MAAVERHLGDAGCGLIEITSNLRRSDAHRFYEGLGYERSSYRFGKSLPPTSPSATAPPAQVPA